MKAYFPVHIFHFPIFICFRIKQSINSNLLIHLIFLIDYYYISSVLFDRLSSAGIVHRTNFLEREKKPTNFPKQSLRCSYANYDKRNRIHGFCFTLSTPIAFLLEFLSVLWFCFLVGKTEIIREINVSVMQRCMACILFPPNFYAFGPVAFEFLFSCS